MNPIERLDEIMTEYDSGYRARQYESWKEKHLGHWRGETRIPLFELERAVDPAGMKTHFAKSLFHKAANDLVKKLEPLLKWRPLPPWTPKSEPPGESLQVEIYFIIGGEL